LNKAFTLIEVLVASLLICVFSVSFTFLVTNGVKHIREARSITRSVLTAKSMMELMRSEPYDKLFSFNNMLFDKGNGVITISSAGNDRIAVAVKDRVELVTLRSRY
jgi:prepilin-type N-terminal cleavage/methylation domain-containing protein